MAADKETQRKAKRRRRRRRGAARICLAASVFLLAALIPLWIVTERYEQAIRVYFGQPTVYAEEPEGAAGTEAPQYASEFWDPAMLEEASRALARTVAEEGIVLLRNEGQALPLRAGANVSVFGGAAADPYLGEAKDGASDSLLSVLEQAGFHVNTDLWDFYARGGGNSLTGKLEKSLEEYRDAAIVVIRRTPAELAAAGSYADRAELLRLTQEERGLLELAAGSCDHVVAVLNTGNCVDTSFLEEYDIDACLWTGGLGETGLYALAAILNGTVCPSGRLPDTFVYDPLSAPAAANAEAGEIVNSSVPMGDRYQVFAEGIYIGYRYYETRYEDVRTGAAAEEDFKYGETVSFPFGYGLSFTEFSWDNAQLRETAEGWNYAVRVTNTGDTAGAEVVQLYVQRPYTDHDRENGIEKPSVELAGFARTKLLEQGESAIVTIPLTGEALQTFDDVSGKYITEKGIYYVTAARNAHQAVNNVLAAKGILTEEEETGSLWPAEQIQAAESLTQSIPIGTSIEGAGAPVRLAEADLRRYESGFRYLSRADWNGTWPTFYAEGNYLAPAPLLEGLRITTGETGTTSAPVYNTVHGDKPLQLAELKGVNIEDYRWNWLMDQFSWRETYRYVRMAGGVTGAVTESGVPEAFGREGISGLTDAGGSTAGTQYPSATVLAGTFDTALARRVGQLIGEDALVSRTTFWYLPSLALHRLPADVRSAESFSEDSRLAGTIGAAVARGARERGMLPVVGRLALSGEAAAEHGTAVFAKEQAVRELYLSSFRRCLQGGGAAGVMVGTGRIGTCWSGGNRKLITDILREEWGFDGIVMTDALTKADEACCDLLQGLSAGTDLWRNTNGSAFTLRGAQLTYAVRNRFRRAVLRSVAVLSRSNAMNGLSSETKLLYRRPAWKNWRLAVTLAAVLLSAVLFMAYKKLRRPKKTGRASDNRNIRGPSVSGGSAKAGGPAGGSAPRARRR